MMKLKVSHGSRSYTWNVTEECSRIAEPMAQAFNLSVPDFLLGLTKHTLPNQPGLRVVEPTPTAVPAGFGVTPAQDPDLWQRIAVAAECDKVTPALFIWRAVCSSLECAEEDMVVHPQTRRGIGSRVELEEAFCEPTADHPVAGADRHHATRCRNATAHLQEAAESAPDHRVEEAIEIVITWLESETQRVEPHCLRSA